MRVLGIDPGIEITGFGVVDITGANHELVACGVVRTSKDLTLSERLVILEKDLQEVLDTYGPFDLAGVEELFFSKNAKTAFMVGQARGVVLLSLERERQKTGQMKLIEVKPVEVKAAMTGSGNAGKKEVQKMVQLHFGLSEPPQPDDAADAVAVAITAAAHHGMH